MALSDKEISALYFEALGSQHLREQDRKMVTRFAHAVESEVRKQAGSVPLTDEWIRSRCKESWIFDTVKQWVRMTEAAHGIKGKTK